MQISLEIAHTIEQFEAAKNIFKTYADFLGLDLEFQGFSQELEQIQSIYGVPKGCLILAKVNGEYAGAVGLREFKSNINSNVMNIAEMKRMFVLKKYHGYGLGKLLCKEFIDNAKKLGYTEIKLDSLTVLDKAVNLYKKFGFVEIEPYRYNPHPNVIYMGLKL